MGGRRNVGSSVADVGTEGHGGARSLLLCALVLGCVLLTTAGCGAPKHDSNGRLVVPTQVGWDLVKHDAVPALIDQGKVPDGDDLDGLPSTAAGRLRYVLTDVAWAPQESGGTLWSEIASGVVDDLEHKPDGFNRLVAALAGARRPVPARLAWGLRDYLGDNAGAIRASVAGEGDPSADATIRALTSVGAETDDITVGSLLADARAGFTNDVKKASQGHGGQEAIASAAVKWIRPVALVQAALAGLPVPTEPQARTTLIQDIEATLVKSFENETYDALPMSLLPKDLVTRDGRHLDHDLLSLHRQRLEGVLAGYGIDFHKIAADAVATVVAAMERK